VKAYTAAWVEQLQRRQRSAIARELCVWRRAGATMRLRRTPDGWWATLRTLDGERIDVVRAGFIDALAHLVQIASLRGMARGAGPDDLTW
jgi:hypothetical protein